MINKILLIGGPDGVERHSIRNVVLKAEYKVRLLEPLGQKASPQIAIRHRVYRLYPMFVTPSLSAPLTRFWLGVYSRTE